MWRDKENNNKSEEYNRKTTQGRNTIRTTKKQNTEVG